jgi:DeoR family transcriptional regulator, suf operon transcriptional repressor
MTLTHPSSTKEDILQRLLRQERATASDLAEMLGISSQAIRRHLKDLQIEGLLDQHSVQGDMGRPQFFYSLSRLGRDRFPKRYGDFAVSFLDTLVEAVGEQQVGEVLRKQWERKAEDYQQRIGQGSLGDRVQKLMTLRREEGYMAELHPLAHDSTSLAEQREQYILAEHNCAIAEVAESYPTVCGHELEMFALILPDCTVERTNWINHGEHNCGYLIKKRTV